MSSLNKTKKVVLAKLYYLIYDILEKKNVISKYPEKAQEQKALLEKGINK